MYYVQAAIFIGGRVIILNKEIRLSLVDELIMLIICIHNQKPRNPETQNPDFCPNRNLFQEFSRGLDLIMAA